MTIYGHFWEKPILLNRARSDGSNGALDCGTVAELIAIEGGEKEMERRN